MNEFLLPKKIEECQSSCRNSKEDCQRWVGSSEWDVFLCRYRNVWNLSINSLKLPTENRGICHRPVIQWEYSGTLILSVCRQSTTQKHANSIYDSTDRYNDQGLETTPEAKGKRSCSSPKFFQFECPSCEILSQTEKSWTEFQWMWQGRFGEVLKKLGRIKGFQLGITSIHYLLFIQFVEKILKEVAVGCPNFVSLQCWFSDDCVVSAYWGDRDSDEEIRINFRNLSSLEYFTLIQYGPKRNASFFHLDSLTKDEIQFSCIHSSGFWEKITEFNLTSLVSRGTVLEYTEGADSGFSADISFWNPHYLMVYKNPCSEAECNSKLREPKLVKIREWEHFWVSQLDDVVTREMYPPRTSPKDTSISGSGGNPVSERVGHYVAQIVPDSKVIWPEGRYLDSEYTAACHDLGIQFILWIFMEI
ncbi:MAG: hypothetical protein GY795_05310, partial [Desulfobacterales bacterium]|nr:hypothetical protein [Desulfobacterales bacterium]